MKKKPNLLFIFTDQQRPDTLAAYGNDKIHAPHLNQLAEESVVFKNTYVTQPVCTPSRASIMTGLYPHHHGCIANNEALNKEVPIILEQLSVEDYKTAYMGKWHLGDEIVPKRGFDKWISTEDGYRKHITVPAYQDLHCSYHYFLKENGFQPDKYDKEFPTFSRPFATHIPDQYSKPAFTAKEAVQFIEDHKEDPFILYVNFLEPHTPFFSAFDDMYDPEEVGLPEGYFDELGDDVPLKYHFNRKQMAEKAQHGAYLTSEKEWKRLRARYWGLVSLVDKYTGKILESIKQQGLENDTIIVFTSDHGEMMGDFRMLTKGVQYEASVKVPMMIKVPGISPKVIEEPVSHIDLVPTLHELIQNQITASLDGISLVEVMKGNETLEGPDVFVEWNGENGESDWFQDHLEGPWKEKIEQVQGAAARTVVTSEGWKLSLTSAGENELYNLKKDPRERENLYFNKEYKDVTEQLTQKIVKWQLDTNDKVVLKY